MPVTFDCKFMLTSLLTLCFLTRVDHTFPADVYLCNCLWSCEIYISQISIYVNNKNGGGGNTKNRSTAMWIASRWISVPPDICAA